MAQEYLNLQKSCVDKDIYVIKCDAILTIDSCDKLVNFFESHDAKEKFIWDQTNNVICDSINVVDDEKFKKKFNGVILDIIVGIIKTLRCFTHYTCQGYECLLLRKIYGPTKLHCDGLGTLLNRNLSVIVSLNSDYHEGHIYFPKQDVKIRLDKGEILVFPPYWTHPHRVFSPVDDTYRYTLNFWLTE
jgi:hypothetical protein